MRRLILAAMLLAGAAQAQTPVFDSVSAGNLPYNVKGAPYNAKCDGTTDDTAAIQSAINAGQASGKDFTLFIPAGVCVISSALTITSSGQNVTVKGESRASSQILVNGTGDGIDVNINPVGGIFRGQWDMADITMLASGAAGTAVKLVSVFPNCCSPKFHHVRIGWSGSGSFANGISTALMSNIIAEDVTIGSQNTTGIGFQLDGNSTFPSINNHFTDMYLQNFAVGIQMGNGSTSYVQGIEITNSIFLSNTCVKWDNHLTGAIADMLLISNSHCNPGSGNPGGIILSFVENVVLTGNYFLAGGIPEVYMDTAGSCTINGNTLFGNNAANTTGISLGPNTHCNVANNNMTHFNATGTVPILLDAASSANVVVNNRCRDCGNTQTVVTDNGANYRKNNINIDNGTNPGVAPPDNTPSLIIAEQTWRWQVPASPTLTLSGMVIGWNYAGLGETDLFTSRGAGGGPNMQWYDTTTGAVGNLLMSLDQRGLVAPTGGVQQPVTTVATLPTCNTALKGTLRAVSDATTPAYNVALTGGGAVSVPVYCNGTAWVAH